MQIFYLFDLVTGTYAFFLILFSKEDHQNKSRRLIRIAMLSILMVNILFATYAWVSDLYIPFNDHLRHLMINLSLIITPLNCIGIIIKTDRKKANPFQVLMFLIAWLLLLLHLLFFIMFLLLYGIKN